MYESEDMTFCLLQNNGIEKRINLKCNVKMICSALIIAIQLCFQIILRNNTGSIHCNQLFNKKVSTWFVKTTRLEKSLGQQL